LLHNELQRDRKEYGAKVDWIRRSMQHLHELNRERLPHVPLWAVVQGYDIDSEDERAARVAARRSGASMVVVARSRVDQSFEPRFVRVEPK
jgi:hypothetical protein